MIFAFVLIVGVLIGHLLTRRAFAAVVVPPRTRVLDAITAGNCYGFDIAEASRVGTGSLYAILHALEEEGVITGDWEPPRADGKRQRYTYRRAPA